MLNKVFQNYVNQVEEIVQAEFGITDNSGIVIACTDKSRIGLKDNAALLCIDHNENSLVFNGCTYEKIYFKGVVEFIIFIKSQGQEVQKYLSLISLSITNLKSNHDERFDRNNFIKGILTGSVSGEEIALRSKELHVSINTFRVVFLIRISDKSKDLYIHEILQNLFPQKMKDFIIVVDDKDTLLVKELKTASDTKEIEKTANIIIDTLTSELMVKPLVGIGNVVKDINDLGKSFKEANTALMVGKIFESDKRAFYYNSLGVGRLIYKLPVESCQMFMKEISGGELFENIDSETALTITKFFENNLNISEASRQLYIHRNTLVYRLDKIQKLTGLDLRVFDDAIMFKLAILVNKYISTIDK